MALPFVTCTTCAAVHEAAMRSPERESWRRALCGTQDGHALVGVGVPACETCWVDWPDRRIA